VCQLIDHRLLGAGRIYLAASHYTGIDGIVGPGRDLTPENSNYLDLGNLGYTAILNHSS
jgi:hypothetical protein